VAKEALETWVKEIAENEKVFERGVYKNPNLTELDMVHFRARIFAMLARGEQLSIQFYHLGLAKKLNPTDYFKLIDENMQGLISDLNKWQAPLEAQPDIPQSFKDAVQEMNRGELESLDDVLEEE
jgi:hypothetical protein